MVCAPFSPYIISSLILNFIRYPTVIEQLTKTHFLSLDDDLLKSKRCNIDLLSY